MSHSALMRSITAPTVAGSISDGVPPPKKIVSTRRSGASRAAWSSSFSSASRQRVLLDAVAHMGIEVAVGALRFAERPMDIDAQAGARHRKQASTSRRKARPRWLMAFFSASVISAVVRVSPFGWKQGS